MSATVLITGAGGFLGQYLVAEFRSAGRRVISVVRDGADTSEDIHAITLPSPKFVDLVRAEQPDGIIHAAGPASVAQSMTDPAADFAASINPLLCVLDAVRVAAPHCRLVLLSSAAVYGNARCKPIPEDIELAPISPYGHHKKMAEELLAEYHHLYALRTAVVRIFSAYGPGLRRQVMWEASTKMLTANPAVLRGTGEESRDFIHAADVARGVRCLLERARFEATRFNLATGIETTIAQLAAWLRAALEAQCEITFNQSRRAGDPVSWRADIGSISALGFRPRIPIEQGVAEFAAWAASQIQAPEGALI